MITHLTTIIVILGLIVCITLIPYWIGRLVLRIIFKDDSVLFVDKFGVWLVGIVSVTILLLIGWIFYDTYISLYNTINTIITNK